MPRRSVVLALVLGLAAPVGADAATAIPVGTGVEPSVALDGAGTAYIAWNGDELQSSTIRFCKLPRGAAVCSVATTITDPAHTSLSRPFLFVSGAMVRIVQYRYGADPGLFEFSSVNGGGMFGEARKVGTAVFDDAVVGPGTTLSGVTNAVTGGTLFQNVAIDGTSAAASAEVNLSVDHPYAGAIALLGGTTPLVVFDNGSGLAQFRRYDGSGPLNSVSNWTPAVDIGYADYPSLASGSLGLFMLSGDETNAIIARRFDGSTFGAPARVLGPAEDVGSWLTHDPGGRLHAVIPQGSVDGLHLVHATSDDGAAWRSGTVLVQSDGGIFDVRSAVAADHVGVAVWSTSIITGPRAGIKEIRVTAIGPDAPGAGPPQAGLPKGSQPPATAVRLANDSVRVAVKGVLRRPAGVSRSRACRGTVRVRFKAAKRAIGATTVNVTQTCAFRGKLLLAATKVKAARKLAMTVRFNGNAAMAPAARTYKLPIKRRR